MSNAMITTLYERGGRHDTGGSPDLRHAIMQLQFGCSSEEQAPADPALLHVVAAESADSHQSCNSAHDAHEWRLLDKVNNIISCFDSYIDRGNAIEVKVSTNFVIAA